MLINLTVRMNVMEKSFWKRQYLIKTHFCANYFISQCTFPCLFLSKKKLESELQQIEEKFESKKQKFVDDSEKFNDALKKVSLDDLCRV